MFACVCVCTTASVCLSVRVFDSDQNSVNVHVCVQVSPVCVPFLCVRVRNCMFFCMNNCVRAPECLKEVCVPACVLWIVSQGHDESSLPLQQHGRRTGRDRGQSTPP